MTSRCVRAAPVRRLLRTVALWLVVLALPWHGVAAATMLHAPSTASQTPARAEAPCHGTTPEGASAAAAAESATPRHAPSGRSSTCAACSACCVIASMPGQLLADAPRVFAGRVVPTATAPRVAFLTDGPLRPPRFPLA